MIEQQYYTRERGGLFSQTDGYDTVAKSPQLKLDYIKKIIHPLCSYDIPMTLQKAGQQDESQYPPSMVILPGPSGELIVGQAVYKAKDFTGLRSTFFMHNFILSEIEKQRYIKEPKKLFGITGFSTNFEISEGRQLPTLAAIPYESNNVYFLERERLFSKLGMSQEIFHKLIYATFIAVHSKKKIYIVLNVELNELGDMAKALLYHLYTVLPWSIAEKLGVCTYANKVEAKKNIQITFLDRNTLRYDSRIGKDFIFDFANKKYLNVDGAVESEPYIRLALSYSRNKMAWDKINYWAEILGSTLSAPEACDISFYGRVITLFEMSLCLKAGKGYDITSQKIRDGLIKQVLTYLQGNIPDDIEKELFEILEYIIVLLQEEIRQGQLIEIDELRELLAFKLDYCKNREQEEHCIQIILYLLTVSSRSKDYSYVYAVLDQVHLYQKTYLHLFEAICNNDELRKQVAYYLINENFKSVKSLDELIEQMAKFEEVECILLKDRYYTQVVYEKFGGCIRGVTDQIAFLNQLQKWCKKHNETIYTNLLEQGEHYVLEHLNLKTLPNDQVLCGLKWSRSYDASNYEVIKDYQNLKTDLSFMSPSKIHINHRVQELVKLFYKQKAKNDEFYMLVYAFLEMNKSGYGPILNLKKVLAYLNDIKPSKMMDFIVWAKGQEMYINKERFDKDVISFFVNRKQKGKKVDKELIKTKLGSQLKTKALCDKILYALKPVLIKWMAMHTKLVASMVFIVVGLSITTTILYMKQNDKWLTNKPAVSEQVINADPKILTKLMPDFQPKAEIKALIEKLIKEAEDEEESKIEK